MGVRLAVGVLAAAALLAMPAGAVAVAPTSCGGPTDNSFRTPTVITGEFEAALQGSYVMLPFDVPTGATAVRVRYCFDQPDIKPPGSPIGNTLDLGIYDARSGPADLWDEDEFRGWGGSTHPDVTISPNGFSSEAQYLANPRAHVHGRTTRGFEPGPMPAGQWAVELGLASITSQSQRDADGKLAWRVEIQSSTSSDWSNAPYQPAAYDPGPANPGPGWYAGDLHVHAEHSSLGDATDRETFDYAFRPMAQGGAGLDFITLSDYVTDTNWDEIGRYQADYPGKLIERSAEVITYRGHTNNHGSHTYVDYRTGPIYERQSSGTLMPMRPGRPASAIFDDVHAAGGWTQINHPTIFPSQVPGFSSFCRGCPWDYSAAETDYSKVDAIEIATGPAGLQAIPPVDPGPNPFTLLGIQFYEHALDTGAKIAAVGSSDSHNAGRTPDPVTQAPIGQATTVVFAPALSEKGIQKGVEAGHTYVKIWGNEGPDVRFEARVPGSSADPAIMGDRVKAASVNLTARVIGAGPSAPRPGPYVLFVLRNGQPFLAIPVPSDDFSITFPSAGPARYRLQVQRLGGIGSIETVSSPIYHEAAAGGGGGPGGGGPGGGGPGGGWPGGGSGGGGAGSGTGAGAGQAGLRPGACTNLKRGGSGPDTLIGTLAGDVLRGLTGNDVLKGLRGDDCLYGGGGNDRLLGNRGNDTLAGGTGNDRLAGGRGRDSLRGGGGNDLISSRDGRRETVRCGPGRADIALADRQDRLIGCEARLRG
jgi:hemolysin type calcium-binding protein